MPTTNKDLSKEWLKCKLNPLYFIFNYVKVPVVGGYVQLSFDNTLPKHRAIVKAIYRFHNLVVLGSRRSYKTTFALAYALWANLFYPNYKTVIVNYKKDSAKDNLNTIKAMYRQLPDFLKVPLKWKGEKLEYIEWSNGSKISIMVPASNVDPHTIGRGLNIPLLIWDETAFVKDGEQIWAAAQPALRSAREQAIKHRYPYGIFMISTPNGKEGKGKFFYEQYSYATPMEELYDFDKEDWLVDNPEEYYHNVILKNNPYRNTFLRIRIHWSEFPQYDDEWYEEQKRELGYYTSAEGRRRVNQELDLMFLGSEESLFPDEILSELQPQKPIDYIQLPYGSSLKLFEELDPNKYYVIGIDTAKTIAGDYSAIEIFDAETFNQVGELKYKFGMVDRFVDAIKQLVQILYSEYNIKKFKLFIENNSFGNQVVESLINDINFDYSSYLYYQVKKNGSIDYGITTTGKTKELIIDCFYEAVLENPKRIKSQDLISEMHVIEKKGQKIAAAKGYHDDLFMASSFAAFGRKELIKSGEIILDEEELKKEQKHYKSLISNIQLVDPNKDKIPPKEKLLNDPIYRNLLISDEEEEQLDKDPLLRDIDFILS